MNVLLLFIWTASAQDVYDAEKGAFARLWGSAGDENLHGPVAAGDWDGDSITDTAVGNFQGIAYYFGAGEVQLLDQSLVHDDVDLDDAPVNLIGGSEHDYLGTAVLNFPEETGADGILVGADHSGLTETDQGQVLLWHAPLGLNGWNSAEGADAVIRGDGSGDLFGQTVIHTPDMDGDGLDDWVIGAPGRDNSYTDDLGHDVTNAEAGRVWIVFNQFRDADGALNAGEVATTTITGASETLFTGWRLCSGGDHDGDGLADLVVGTLDQSANFGGELLLFTHLPASAGITTGAAAGAWIADHPFAYAGTGLACGDPDQDGIADVWIGGPYLDGATGRVWHVAGSPKGREPLDAAASDVASGEYGSAYGASIAYGSELLIGAPNLDQVTVAAPDLTVSYLLTGPPGFGAWVGWPGDLNNDGVTDAAVTAPNTTATRRNQGVALLLSGVDLLTENLPDAGAGDPVDLDGDTIPGTEDCDDLDPRRSPLEDEVCKDGIDNNCDASIDEDPCVRGCASAPGSMGWWAAGLAALALRRRRLMLALPLLAACSGTPPLTLSLPGGALAGIVDVTVAGNYDQLAVLVDGVTLGGGVAPAQTFAWDTRSVADGEHLVTGLGFIGDNPPVEVNETVEVSQSSTDASPPSVRIVSPADGERLPGELIPIVLAVSDDVAIASVEILANDSLLATLPPEGPFELAWENVLEGDYTLTAVATDVAGNGGGASIHVTVSNLAEVGCTVSDPEAGAEVFGEEEVKVGASSSAGMVQVEVFANTTSLGVDVEDTPWSVIWDSTAWTGQSVDLTARCTAADGGYADAPAVTVTVAKTAPPFTVTLHDPPDGATVTGNAVLLKTAMGGGAGPDHADFYVDDILVGTDADDTGGFTYDWDSTLVPNGIHVVKTIGYESGTAFFAEDSATVTVSN